MKKVEVFPYNTDWPVQFEKEAMIIRTLLSDRVIEIYHIGSTAVPGLCAKKDIDIILVIHELESSLLLQKIGYVFKGELNVPLRYYFSKNTDSTKVNLHVCEKDHGFISLNLAFRDWLRTHEKDKEAYEQLKHQILKSPEASLKTKGPFVNYTLQKAPFIKSIIRQAYDGLIVNFCTHPNEWEVVKSLRNRYLSKLGNIQDPSLLTFEKHKHFILYQGADIVGYLPIQLHSPQAAQIRMMIMEASDTREDYSKVFIKIIEDWLKHHQYQWLFVETLIDRVSFYQTMGFDEVVTNKHKNTLNQHILMKKSL